MASLDAIVLAGDPLARVRIAGLSARERAIRVARRLGADRVHVVESDASRAALGSWRATRQTPLVVIRADQLVHTALVQPLVEALPNAAVAVVPEQAPVNDLTAGAYAGAFIVGAADAPMVIEALARGETDSAIAENISGALRVPHGAVARAPIATREQRREAHRLLYRILIKPQDNALTRYLYRPVSFPLTRLLVWTPITPNQISYFVAAMVAVGCWITAHREMELALLGSVTLLVASYIDCCDGEIARVKLLSSRFGAWIDTIVDELSSVGYMIALGLHCRQYFGADYFGPLPVDPWLVAIALGTVTYLWCIYCIYYNIIVAVGSANSQDYVGRFDVVPGKEPNSVRLAPATTKGLATKQPLPQPLEFLATYMPYIVRRDFISWSMVGCAALHVTQVAFATLILGGVISFVILTVDHFKLRSLRRSVERRGMWLEEPGR